MAANCSRVIEELKELRLLTGNAQGAQRVAWTETWDNARKWLLSKLAMLPVKTEIDEAGNLWATYLGESSDELLIGGHIDSVPHGGWLDGSLNIVAALEVLRRVVDAGKSPITVRLVDWADEEGARFGRSLFGSSCATGSIQPDVLRELKDKDGVLLSTAIGRYGLTIDNLTLSGRQLKNAKAYLELHIEQGPVLERLELPLAAVLGTVGIIRHAVSFVGQSAHAGTTPMDMRGDALLAASKFCLEVREIAIGHGGVGTVGKIEVKPGISSAVPGQCELLVEQRHLDTLALDEMWRLGEESARRCADAEKVTVSCKRIWQIPPMLFDAHFINLCEDAIREAGVTSHRMASGALHDASEMARANIPTAMLFVQSLRGLSHTKEEDTKEEHLSLAVEAFDKLASKVIQSIS